MGRILIPYPLWVLTPYPPYTSIMHFPYPPLIQGILVVPIPIEKFAVPTYVGLGTKIIQ